MIVSIFDGFFKYISKLQSFFSKSKKLSNVFKLIKAIFLSKSESPLSNIELIVKLSCLGKFPIIVCIPADDIIEILSPTSLALRVYDRGVGETLACGSSACAAVVLGNHLELCKENVGVVFKTGNLNIRYQKTSGRLTAKVTAEFLGNLMI